MTGWSRLPSLALLAVLLMVVGLGLSGSRFRIAAAQTLGAASQTTPPAPTPTPVPESGGYSPSFTVSGSVHTPTTYTLAALQGLPSQTVTTQYSGDASPEQHTYQGVRLYDLLLAAAPQFASQENGDKVGWYVQVTAIDGYEAVVAWGELDPENEGKAILVAYAADGQLLGLGYGMAELVVPGDSTDSRYVTSIMSITVSPATR
jgi:DMSO/TMAO reductase YedYZ molybdopterin-dependent catalytic subunit